MKFGIGVPIPRLSLGEAETLTVKAEELGLDGVFFPDHILSAPATTQRYGPNWPDPFSVLAYLAGRTSRIELGISVIVLPYRHPVVTAKAAATVDQVSGGRLIFGVGVGWDEKEFRDLGVPFQGRGRLSDEYLRIIKTVWTSDKPSFEGEHFSFSGAFFSPRPVQQPHPPIWVGGAVGAVSEAAIRRTVELGDAWHPIFLSLEELAKGAALLWEEAARVERRDRPRLASRHHLKLTESAKGSGRDFFEGSVQEVAADIKRAQAVGADYLIFDLPPPDLPGMVRLMERFVKEVAPAAA